MAERVEQGGVEVGLGVDRGARVVEWRAEVAGPRGSDRLEAGVDQKAAHRERLVGAAGRAVDDEDGRALACALDLDRSQRRVDRLGRALRCAGLAHRGETRAVSGSTGASSGRFAAIPSPDERPRTRRTIQGAM